MTVNEVRERYFAFFVARGHAVIPSASIVPENDPTTLFTSSGMQPLVPYLLGKEHPAGKRLANSQLCFRAEDIEEVGDNRHTTFFEMLGNWSLGDYFKKEQLPWFYEFLTNKTEGLGLDPDKIYVTIFSGDEESGMAADEESEEIWRKIGISNKRIRSYGAKKNWWSRSGVPGKMPVGEIGGPDSEVFYDFDPSTSSGQVLHTAEFGEECHQNCDCGRFMEIGNSVFMQFIKKGDGTFGELPNKNVDFGGGLERLAAATQNDSDIFNIDIFESARAVLESYLSENYQGLPLIKTRAFRIILDHTRAAAFMIASGVRPSNTEQGYILRRLIRRAIREVDRLGLKKVVLAEVAAAFADAYAEIYPFVKEKVPIIRKELENEETQFRKTLSGGLRELGKMIRAGSVTGAQASMLYQTFGFPFELTEEVLKESNAELKNPQEFFDREKEHQELSRAGAAGKFSGGLADSSEKTVKYHTAHHILLKALQTVLEPDVRQRGSNITGERLRIDFSYGQKMTPEQITEVERIVNEQIKNALPVERVTMSREEAEKLHAEHEFGAKYPDTVSIYFIGSRKHPFSIEFCGGPHVNNTADLGSIVQPDGSSRKVVFKIIKEEASSAGVRRIKAVLE